VKMTTTTTTNDNINNDKAPNQEVKTCKTNNKMTTTLHIVKTRGQLQH